MKTFTLLVAILVLGILAIKLVIRPWLRRNRTLQNMSMCNHFLLPTLPSHTDQVKNVTSQLKTHKVYQVNLHDLSCTCSRWKQYRGLFPKRDIHRLCRHLRRELIEQKVMHLVDDLSQAIIHDRIRDRCYKRMTICGSEAALGYHPRNEIVRIFARRAAEGDPPEGPFTGAYHKFVLNVQQESWIYGEAPPCETETIAHVSQFLNQIHIPKKGEVEQEGT
uniref:SWIM-type domain-containing protein n=1 Tax=Magnetococcus massalia (strain MO-1) TaxID=451514 RepID=A0A1S7LNH9_MAGMO|nr:Conserved protein of unknown function. Containing zinc ion binding domain [Candidatus Magnetococcus massalia]